MAYCSTSHCLLMPVVKLLFYINTFLLYACFSILSYSIHTQGTTFWTEIICEIMAILTEVLHHVHSLGNDFPQR